MTGRARIAWAFAAALAAAVGPAAAQDAPAPSRLEGVLSELSKRLGAIRTLRARFVQKKYLEVFDEVVTSEGSLALAVPDKLRWEYVKPIKSVLVVDGRRARRDRVSRKGETTTKTYSLDDEPITAITAEQVFLWTRGEFAKARESYELASVSDKPLVIRATPRAERMREVVSAVELTFSDARDRLTGVTLVEKSGAKTEIAFLDIEIDASLPGDLFVIDK